MPTSKKRIAVTLSQEEEQMIYDLRKTDKYCRCSLSEIIRQLMKEQIKRERPTDRPA